MAQMLAPEMTMTQSAVETAERTKFEVKNLNFYYGQSKALKDITLSLPERSVTAFIGPSGCGKSTLLRVFNRIYELYPRQRAEGQVLLDGDNVLDRSQDLNLLLAESYFKGNQVPQGLATVDAAVKAEKAAGRKPPQDWYGRAASMAYKAKLMPEVSKWTRAQVVDYPSAENWRSALVIFGDANHFDDQTQLDLMRLQRFAGALSGERDYYEYAILADKVGLPGEAKAVVDEGKAKGAYNAGSKAVNDIGAAAGAKVAADAVPGPATPPLSAPMLVPVLPVKAPCQLVPSK